MNRSFLRTIGLVLLIAFVPIALVPARGQDAKGKISSALQPYLDSKSLAGAVTLVATKDRVLTVEAVGFADILRMIAMPIDAVFWIASMSKPITGAALMMLVDEGKLKLDDPIEKYLPEFKGQWVIVEKSKDRMVLGKPKRAITVRDVMDHTSGMPFGSALETPTIDVLPLKDAVRSYALTPLNSEPGTQYKYSNAGINTGGRLIEVVSGMPYEVFLDKRLFGPLGMKDTTFWPSEALLKRLAKTYTPGKDKTGLVEMPIKPLRHPLSDITRYPCPGGGLFSTARDCGVFCQMVAAGGVHNGKRLLSEGAVNAMTSRQTAPGIPTSYGVGWAVNGANIGHGGAYATNMNIDSKTGLITVYMVQHAGFPGNGNQALATFRKTATALYAK